ncbi:histone-lysine n-methyltransferase H3 lysine-36 H4 lysine-20 specific [Fusarium mundagurra]|uniref:Histone-lysine n-methyltransferase H3 lysine-36 H4 lysine-20 specific n=1 Tax=Fusarium mundagurra TaxID=1567541 RepID=A0A8H5Z8I9_9HYPO|nr:histone-lysine n-methyltransferase H3 lysine-36 H4 lysine-20 specific [Fusarium mundagurra]
MSLTPLLTQAYEQVTDNVKFKQLDQNYKLNGRQCGICGDWKISLNRHILTQHSGSMHALISNGEATRDKRRYILQSLRNERLKASFSPELIDLVRQMKESQPAKVRYFGGRFLRGPLGGQEVSGMPQFFERSSGRLKYCYMDLINPSKISSSSRKIAKRTCNMSPAQPFPNKSWFRGSDFQVTTSISTNIWTPDKYPNWKGPPGFLIGQDPTWIPGHLRQFRQEIPSIVDTGNMGEGAQATTDYKRGEFLGELVGELAPIGYYTDGWAADLSRDDLSPGGKEVTWCQVYPRYMGNWVRKVNHSCESNCKFESWNISGRWRVMLRATHQIKCNSWILVNYGEEYWAENHACLCGSRYCISNQDMGARTTGPIEEEAPGPDDNAVYYPAGCSVLSS